jgi:hypothetical protein
MLHLKRPPRPANFDQEVQGLRAEAEQEIRRYREDLALGVEKPPKPNFPNAWGRYKAAFAEAQHEKCGYCEVRVIAGFPGDVEHFRPKGELWELPNDPDEWGEQRPSSASVERRKHTVISDLGYWWLAYEWDNWLLSCSACNSGWKESFFPAEPGRVLPPDPLAPDRPLLLNPFDGPDPAGHLRFGELGEVRPNDDSPWGLETIKTCGLDRPSLRLARMEKAQRAYSLVQQIRTAGADEELDEALRDFRRMGNELFDYAGMVRAILLAETGVRWEDLEGIDGG